MKKSIIAIVILALLYSQDTISFGPFLSYLYKESNPYEIAKTYQEKIEMMLDEITKIKSNMYEISDKIDEKLQNFSRDIHRIETYEINSKNKSLVRYHYYRELKIIKKMMDSFLALKQKLSPLEKKAKRTVEHQKEQIKKIQDQKNKMELKKNKGKEKEAKEIIAENDEEIKLLIKNTEIGFNLPPTTTHITTYDKIEELNEINRKYFNITRKDLKKAKRFSIENNFLNNTFFPTKKMVKKVFLKSTNKSKPVRSINFYPSASSDTPSIISRTTTSDSFTPSNTLSVTSNTSRTPTFQFKTKGGNNRRKKITKNFDSSFNRLSNYRKGALTQETKNISKKKRKKEEKIKTNFERTDWDDTDNTNYDWGFDNIKFDNNWDFNFNKNNDDKSSTKLNLHWN